MDAGCKPGIFFLLNGKGFDFVKIKKLIKTPMFWIHLFESLWIWIMVYPALNILKDTYNLFCYSIVHIVTVFFVIDISMDSIFCRSLSGGDDYDKKEKNDK